MNILLENGWQTKHEIIAKLRKKGYDRCEKTIHRLIKMLKDLGFNVMCDQTTAPYTYRANKKRPFI